MPIRLTRSVKVLLVIYFLVFLVQQTGDQFFETHFLGWFGLVPIAVLRHFQVWQLFTYSFLHADVTHLFFNLMMLAFIGSDLEAIWGRFRFLTYYFFCATFSGLLYLVIQLFSNQVQTYPLIGASGAIYGLLTAYGIVFGERVLLFMMLFPMKAKHFVWVLALIQLMTTVYSPGAGWASFAHLGGMLGGFLYLWGYTQMKRAAHQKQQTLTGSQKKKKSRHLRLVVNHSDDFESSEEDGSKSDPKTWH